jgi:hypothetical protein
MEVNTLKRKLKAEEDEHKALNTLWEVINKLKHSINYRRHRLAYPYDFGVRLTIFWAILRPFDCCQFPYDSANLQYFRKLLGSVPSFHCGSVYYRSYRHFRLLKKRCQNVKILIINSKSI